MRAAPSTAAVILALAWGVTSCTGDDTSVASGSDASTDASADASRGAGDGTMGSDGSLQQLTAVRIANWSPGAPAVDVCLAPHGTTAFQGPLFARVVASLLDAGAPADGGDGVLSFPNASAYFDIAPDDYDARIVAAGSPDCSVGIGTDSTALPALQADAFATLAVVGEADPTGGAPALGVVGFQDEGPRAFPPDSGTPPLAARFVNAAVGEARVTASIATRGPGTFTLVAPFGGVGRYGPGELGADDPPIDPDGYASWQVSSAATVTCAVPGQPGILATGTLDDGGGAILTLVLVGSASSPPAADAGPPGSFQLIQCEDNAGTVGLLSRCVAVSP